MKTITRQIQNDDDVNKLSAYLKTIGKPLTVKITDKVQTRTDRMNRLAFLWYRELADQGDMTAEEYRALCKLTIGVPIANREFDDFKEQYVAVIKGLIYEQKLQCMVEPFDLPVTRSFNNKLMSEYLANIHLKFSELGFQLSDPATQGLDEIAKLYEALNK